MTKKKPRMKLNKPDKEMSKKQKRMIEAGAFLTVGAGAFIGGVTLPNISASADSSSMSEKRLVEDDVIRDLEHTSVDELNQPLQKGQSSSVRTQDGYVAKMMNELPNQATLSSMYEGEDISISDRHTVYDIQQILGIKDADVYYQTSTLSKSDPQIMKMSGYRQLIKDNPNVKVTSQEKYQTVSPHLYESKVKAYEDSANWKDSRVVSSTREKSLSFSSKARPESINFTADDGAVLGNMKIDTGFSMKVKADNGQSPLTNEIKSDFEDALEKNFSITYEGSTYFAVYHDESISTDYGKNHANGYFTFASSTHGFPLEINGHYLVAPVKFGSTVDSLKTALSLHGVRSFENTDSWLNTEESNINVQMNYVDQLEDEATNYYEIQAKEQTIESLKYDYVTVSLDKQDTVSSNTVYADETTTPTYNGSQAGISPGGAVDGNLNEDSAGLASWNQTTTFSGGGYGNHVITVNSAVTVKSGVVSEKNFPAVLNTLNLTVDGVSFNQFVSQPMMVNGVQYAGYLTGTNGSGSDFTIIVKDVNFNIYQIGGNFAYIFTAINQPVTPASPEVPSNPDPATPEVTPELPSNPDPVTPEVTPELPSNPDPVTPEVTPELPSNPDPVTPEVTPELPSNPDPVTPEVTPELPSNPDPLTPEVTPELPSNPDPLTPEVTPELPSNPDPLTPEVTPELPSNPDPVTPEVTPELPSNPDPVTPEVTPELPSNPDPLTPEVTPELPSNPDPVTPEVTPELPSNPDPVTPEVTPELPSNPDPATPEVTPELPSNPDPVTPEVTPELPSNPDPVTPEVTPELPSNPDPVTPEVTPELPSNPDPVTPEVTPELPSNPDPLTPEVTPELPSNPDQLTPEVTPELPSNPDPVTPEVTPELPSNPDPVTPEVTPELPSNPDPVTPEVTPELPSNPDPVTPEVTPELPSNPDPVTPEVTPELPSNPDPLTPEVTPELPSNPDPLTPEVTPELPSKPGTNEVDPELPSNPDPLTPEVTPELPSNPNPVTPEVTPELPSNPDPLTPEVTPELPSNPNPVTPEVTPELPSNPDPLTPEVTPELPSKPGTNEVDPELPSISGANISGTKTTETMTTGSEKLSLAETDQVTPKAESVSSTDSSTKSGNNEQITKLKSSDETSTHEKTNPEDKVLPRTGSSSSTFGKIWGVILIGLAWLLGLFKRRRPENENKEDRIERVIKKEEQDREK